MSSSFHGFRSEPVISDVERASEFARLMQSDSLVNEIRKLIGSYDPLPGYYCCITPFCRHPREQVFHGGGGFDDAST